MTMRCDIAVHVIWTMQEEGGGRDVPAIWTTKENSMLQVTQKLIKAKL